MPNTKDQYLRFQIIDDLMQGGRHIKTKELKYAIEKRLDLDSISERTIRNDLKYMKRPKELGGYNAPIIHDRSTRSFFYSNPNFTISRIHLTEHEISSLKLALKSLEAYKKHIFFDNLNTAIDKILNTLQIREHTGYSSDFVQFNKKSTHTGDEYIPDILKAHQNSLCIDFEYQKFEDQHSTDRTIAPYLLKEYADRWYVIGKEIDQSDIKTFALDRIKSLNISRSVFTPCNFDFEEYYKSAFAITVLSNKKPIEVKLAFSPQQSKYIQSLPLHQSQKVTFCGDSLVATIKVIPSYELYAKLLSFGDQVEVIAPEEVRTHISTTLKNAVKKYF